MIVPGCFYVLIAWSEVFTYFDAVVCVLREVAVVHAREVRSLLGDLGLVLSGAALN